MRPDGAIEVAKREGEVDRYLVLADGSTTLLGSLPPPSGLRRGTPIAIGGAVLIAFAIAMQALGVAGPVAVAFVGWMLIVAGVGIRSLSADLTTRLKREGEWHTPTDLHGWLPRSVEQLGAVEEIADEHDGLAYVRELGSRTVEVQAMHKGLLEHFWVDEGGRAELRERTSLARRHYVNRTLQGTSIALWLAFLVALVSTRWLLAGVAAGCLVAVMVADWVNDRKLDLEQRMTSLPRDGQEWFEIRTRIVENDG